MRERVVGRFHLIGIELVRPFGAIVAVRGGKILSAIGYSAAGSRKALD